MLFCTGVILLQKLQLDASWPNIFIIHIPWLTRTYSTLISPHGSFFYSMDHKSSFPECDGVAVDTVTVVSHILLL